MEEVRGMTGIDLSRGEWRKSSYSSQSGNCVEVARNLPGWWRFATPRSPTEEFSDVADQASRVVIFQAPMADQPIIQPAMTVIIAQVGMGGRCSKPPPPGPTWVPPASAAGFSWSMATPTTRRSPSRK
jgi:hypothetical protein